MSHPLLHPALGCLHRGPCDASAQRERHCSLASAGRTCRSDGLLAGWTAAVGACMQLGLGGVDGGVTQQAAAADANGLCCGVYGAGWQQCHMHMAIQQCCTMGGSKQHTPLNWPLISGPYHAPHRVSRTKVTHQSASTEASHVFRPSQAWGSADQFGLQTGYFDLPACRKTAAGGTCCCRQRRRLRLQSVKWGSFVSLHSSHVLTPLLFGALPSRREPKAATRGASVLQPLSGAAAYQD